MGAAPHDVLLLLAHGLDATPHLKWDGVRWGGTVTVSTLAHAIGAVFQNSSAFRPKFVSQEKYLREKLDQRRSRSEKKTKQLLYSCEHRSKQQESRAVLYEVGMSESLQLARCSLAAQNPLESTIAHVPTLGAGGRGNPNPLSS